MNKILKNYCALAALASAAIAFYGCTKGGEDNTDTAGGNTMRTSAKIEFVSRLADAPLISAPSDNEAVEAFLGSVLNNRETLVILDRTDRTGVSGVADMMKELRKFSAFVLLGQDGTEKFDISTLVFNYPASSVPGYEIISGCYVSGLPVNVDGTVTNFDAGGNAAGSHNVSVTVPVYSCRFDTGEQIDAFGGASGVMDTMKSAGREFVIIGTVRNGLMSSLQSAVASADSGYAAAEVFKGPDYSIFMVYGTRYWGFNGVSESEITDGITAYAVDISWK